MGDEESRHCNQRRDKGGAKNDPSDQSKQADVASGVGLRASARWDMERTSPLPCTLSLVGAEMMGTHSFCPGLLVTTTACSTASYFSYVTSN